MWRAPRTHEEINDAFVQKIITLWDQGLDTWEISRATSQSQADCERALHAGLEKRRGGDPA